MYIIHDVQKDDEVCVSPTKAGVNETYAATRIATPRLVPCHTVIRHHGPGPGTADEKKRTWWWRAQTATVQRAETTFAACPLLPPLPCRPCCCFSSVTRTYQPRRVGLETWSAALTDGTAWRFLQFCRAFALSPPLRPSRMHHSPGLSPHCPPPPSPPLSSPRLHRANSRGWTAIQYPLLSTSQPLIAAFKCSRVYRQSQRLSNRVLHQIMTLLLLRLEVCGSTAGALKAEATCDNELGGVCSW